MNDAFSELLAGVIRWFGDPAHWSGAGSIPAHTLKHVFYMLISTVIGALIALPIGIGLGHSGRGGLLAINITNIGRAVPSFGVIIFVFLLVGYGLVPVIVALVALAIPPMVTNSYVGMREVDPAVRQASKALGMTGWQRLTRVELPIAMPLIMAGVRTSAVQVMSTATLAAYVGLGGLGRYLIDGLQLRDMAQVLVGAILVALLAIVTELLLALLQRLVTARGLRGRQGSAE
ncbi:ABC transporter permease [Kushneria aurantia]|uniref:ABC transporter permease n=1 Tax=Kushneria aurantia TaxID=504092 RepID=A0ABV6FZC5_9GAMM|nr:ABC transporter permease [Kushneria aurantia]